jgi:hypothetical protein
MEYFEWRIQGIEPMVSLGYEPSMNRFTHPPTQNLPLLLFSLQDIFIEDAKPEVFSPRHLAFEAAGIAPEFVYLLAINDLMKNLLWAY